MTKPLQWLSWIALLTSVGLAGCGGSINPVVSTITFPNGNITSVAPGAVVAMAATVTNDPRGLGVDWSVVCTPPVGTIGAPANACGTFSPTHTASGAFTNFTAPNAIPVSTAVTIFATSTSDPTRVTKFDLEVAGAGLTVSISPAQSNVEVNGQAQYTATVTNDPANAGVQWTLTCGQQSGLDCGQLLETQSASDSPITYVAPAVAPAGLVTLTATSITNPTVIAQATITVVPAITVNFFTAPPAILGPGASANLIATVTNDFGNAGVTWSATGGTFSALQTASGVATVYTAPTAAAGTVVVITAASVTDPTKTVSATITIAFNVSVGISTAVTTMHAGATANFAAIVLNDGANAGVRWSSSAGSFSPVQTASGVVTAYTAPAAIPSGGTVTVTATSITDSTKSATATVTITAPLIAIAIAPPSASVQEGGLAGFVAVVTNDSTNSGVTWSATAGSFNPLQTASGAATLYTAPSTVPSSGTATITATSVADPTVTATATVTISSGAPSLSVTVSPTKASLKPGATQSFTAVVTNDSANAGVTWTVTSGSVSLSQTASGTATVYTAPSTPPAGGTATITATSVSDSTQSASAAITIAVPSNNGTLSGQYAFALTGQNSTGGTLDLAYESYLGSITADGSGNITAGEVDFNSFDLGAGSMNIAGLTGTYSLDSNGHGTISLSSTAQGFALTLSVSMVSGNHGLVMSAATDPNNGQLNGTIDLQTPSSFSIPLSGSYAFNFALPDTGGFEPDDLGGILTISSGTITNYLTDENQSGSPIFNSTPATDAFGPPDNNGRGLITLSNFGSQSGLPFVYYVVDSTHFIFGTTQGGGALGTAYLQPATLPTSLAGTYAFTTVGFNAGGSISNYIDAGGVFTCDSGGNLTKGKLDVNNNGSFTTGAITGTCAMDSPADGRGTITITSGGSGGVSSFALYPTASNGYLMLELDTSAEGIGTAYPQATGVSASTFTGTYAGSFFTQGMLTGGSTTLLGPVTASGTTPLTGSVDINDFAEVTATIGATLTGTGNLVDTGNGRLTGEFAAGPTTGGGSLTYDLQQVFYVIDANTVLSLESDSSPGTGILQLPTL